MTPCFCLCLSSIYSHSSSQRDLVQTLYLVKTDYITLPLETIQRLPKSLKRKSQGPHKGLEGPTQYGPLFQLFTAP